MDKFQQAYLKALKSSVKKRVSSGGMKPRGPERAKIMATAKRSARSKLAHARMSKDKINVDELAKMFEIPAYEDLDERNIDYVADAGHYAAEHAQKEGLSEREIEEAREEAEMEAQDEVYQPWYDGILHVSEKLFGEHKLELKPIGKDKRPWEYKILPKTTWEDAAREIIQTINGVGYFHFNSLKEFMDSGPYTARESVLSHIHWIADWPRVYGEGTARSMYDRYVR